ncbi:phasin family protein [Bradyrhizobium sp. 190]|uniref:phasin family protein n=1 Tax=Bradyrhizobium sp. 190 TaxID=2782658 RepID=UPI001FF8FF24|nr:phasin family protein [Bradyrhizobium sp. 190]MCK1518354.1 phasin family protein [Bradyrhizobium sp. 190]
MSKRKPAKASKRAHSPKIAARAHRNKQDIVRSAKDELLRSVAAGPIESPLELHDDSKQKAPIVEKQEASSVEKQMAPIAENRMAVLRDRFGQTEGFDFSLATANMLASQAKLLEMAQTNMRFAFEFNQRLARIRSPFEFFDLTAEFTRRRIDMFRKHSNEIAALTAAARSGSTPDGVVRMT